MRITNKDLEAIVKRINEATNSPTDTWDDRYSLVAQIGNYHLSGAYGGWSLHQTVSEHGGIRDVLACGHIPKRDLYHRMQAYLYGLKRQ